MPGGGDGLDRLLGCGADGEVGQRPVHVEGDELGIRASAHVGANRARARRYSLKLPRPLLLATLNV
ncbi:hypothetical protein SFR_3995 [Streptomyces sp. FR-008]|nr:hypothetical protein SFR_3995 [Streptomyces sp. FR-008]